MNELMQAFRAIFDLIGDNLFLFLGLPLAFTAFGLTMNIVKIMCQPPRRIMTERLSVPVISDKKPYLPPVLHFHNCPVSDNCVKCRFHNTDRCLKSYL